MGGVGSVSGVGLWGAWQTWVLNMLTWVNGWRGWRESKFVLGQICGLSWVYIISAWVKKKDLCVASRNFGVGGVGLRCFDKKVLSKIYRKTPVLKPLVKQSCRLQTCKFIKKATHAQVLYFEVCEISNYFVERLHTFITIYCLSFFW